MAWPPGFTLSVVSSETRLLTEMTTVALCPAFSVPDAGLTLSVPSRLDGSLTDQLTGPPSAVIVTWVPPSVLSTMLVGDTLSVPGAAEVGGGAGEDGEEDDGRGAGEDRDGAGEVGDLPGELAPGVVGPGLPPDVDDALASGEPGLWPGEPGLT